METVINGITRAGGRQASGSGVEAHHAFPETDFNIDGPKDRSFIDKISQPVNKLFKLSESEERSIPRIWNKVRGFGKSIGKWGLIVWGGLTGLQMATLNWSILTYPMLLGLVPFVALLLGNWGVDSEAYSAKTKDTEDVLREIERIGIPSLLDPEQKEKYTKVLSKTFYDLPKLGKDKALEIIGRIESIRRSVVSKAQGKFTQEIIKPAKDFLIKIEGNFKRKALELFDNPEEAVAAARSQTRDYDESISE